MTGKQPKKVWNTLTHGIMLLILRFSTWVKEDNLVLDERSLLSSQNAERLNQLGNWGRSNFSTIYSTIQASIPWPTTNESLEVWRPEHR